MLKKTSLAGCSLSDERVDAQETSLALICKGNYGTTGQALWRRGNRMLYGRLDVKLGGKNMTFYQRITATPVGEYQE